MTTIQTIGTTFCLSTMGLVVVGLMGCASQDLVEPSELTLPAAMTNLATSMVALKKAETDAAHRAGYSNGWNQGLMPSSVVVTLNLAASKANTNSFAIAASSPAAPTTSPTGNGSAAFGSAASGNRSTSITITYNSLYFNPTAGAAATTSVVTNYVGSTANTNVAGTSTNSSAVSTNYAVSTTITKPSNLNDPATVTNLINTINMESTNRANDNGPIDFQ